MKIAVVGDYMWPWYQESFAKALRDQGVNVLDFPTAHYFYKYSESHSQGVIIRSLWHRVENRLKFGPIVVYINMRFFLLCFFENPDWIFNYNSQLIFSSNLNLVKKLTKCRLSFYSNDDPWSDRNKFRNFINGIQHCDAFFYYREKNKFDVEKLAGNLKLFPLLPYFDPNVHHPSPLGRSDKFDVIFVGHYENDGRAEKLLAVKEAGFRLGLFGSGWDVAHAHFGDSLFEDVIPILGKAYVDAVASASIALCFLSKINSDGYTRRSFELPAMGACVLSERTAQLENFFEEGREIVFFDSSADLIDKLRFLLGNKTHRQKIARYGRQRVWDLGGSVNARAREFTSVLDRYF